MRTAEDGSPAAGRPRRDAEQVAALIGLLRLVQGATAWVARYDSGPPGASVEDELEGGAGPGAAAERQQISRAEAAHIALEVLLARLHEPLRRFALGRAWRLPDAADFAADVAQMTLIRVAEAIHLCEAKTDGQIIAWALAIARRVLIDLLRRSGSRPVARDAAALAEGDPGNWAHADSGGGGPDGSPEFEVLLRLVVQAYRMMKRSPARRSCSGAV